MKKTLQDLNCVLGKIRTHPEYSDCIKRNYLAWLRSESNKHSISLEEGVDDSALKRQLKKDCYDGLERARACLSERGICLSSLSQLGHMVAPIGEDGQPTPNAFRCREVLYGGFSGAKAQTIHQSMNDLAFFLNNDIDIHPVLRAIEAHLRTVQIHPYIDGNGRVARLLQNFCLEQNDFPPAIIEPSEKEHYLGLMKHTLISRYKDSSSIQKPSDDEELLHTFIASKILQSAYKLEDELRRKRIYNVQFESPTKELVYSVVKSIRGFARGRDKSLKASIGGNGYRNANIIVQGDVSLRELEKLLGKRFEKIGRKYSISSLTCFN